MDIWFRLRFSIQPALQLYGDADTSAHTLSGRSASVRFEREDGNYITQSFVTVERVVAAPDDSEQFLRDIVAARLPNTGPGTGLQWLRVLIASGMTVEDAIQAPAGTRFASTIIIDVELLPDRLKDLVLEQTSELTTIARDVVRWRRYHLDEAHPLTVRRVGVECTWSIDGERWAPLPQRRNFFSAEGVVTASMAQRDDGWRRIEEQADSEPLAYDLLSEARIIVRSNPRSALVIGCAAAEVAVKAFLVARAENVEWLIMNAPSPPIVGLLTHNVTPLKPKDAPAIPKRVRNGINDLVKLRNALVHRGEGTADPKPVIAALDHVSDLLRILDYYDGRAWALQYCTPETQEIMETELRQRML